MTITEISVYPENREGNKAKVLGTVSGDFNTLNPMFCALKKQLDRRKESYIFKVVSCPSGDHYAYNLKNSEFESCRKFIPGFPDMLYTPAQPALDSYLESVDMPQE